MDWELMKQQLEAILNAPLQITSMPAEEWNRYVSEQTAGQASGLERAPTSAKAQGKSVVVDHNVYFFLQKQGDAVTVLRVSEVLLTASERQLVELMIETKRAWEKKPAAPQMSDEEKKVAALREWLLQQAEQGVSEAELPDPFVSQFSLYTTKIPLLLYGDYSQSRRVLYHDLKKLLESFFDAEIILIPLLEKEWLILGSESLLSNGSNEDKEEDEEETPEEALEALVSGLYEMLANEWVGECHLAIDYPMKPSQGLLASTLRLREAMALGRTFHVGSNIHLPWLLHLEKLLHLIPDRDKSKFLDQVLKGAEHVLDAETQTTLEQFFALDCNVSETAKKLYVHRNTLLYRLDKFKQETGLDVRSFNDAVLVRIALLLYKVTKRK